MHESVCYTVNIICRVGTYRTLIGIFASIGQSLLWWPLVREHFGSQSSTPRPLSCTKTWKSKAQAFMRYIIWHFTWVGFFLDVEENVITQYYKSSLGQKFRIKGDNFCEIYTYIYIIYIYKKRSYRKHISLIYCVVCIYWLRDLSIVSHTPLFVYIHICTTGSYRLRNWHARQARH